MKLLNRRWVCIAAAGVAIALYASCAMAATTHLGNNQWWLDNSDWSGGLSSTTDMQLNSGYDFAGEGVVFDPDNDPNLGATPLATDPYLAYRLYISHTDTAGGLITVVPANKLTIKSGELNPSSYMIIGRAANTTGVLVQTGGTLRLNGGTNGALYFGDTNAGVTSIFDYYGGSVITSDRFRMAKSPSTFAKMILHNTETPGLISVGTDFVMSENATGISEVEFHYGNGGVRTINADRLSLRNDDAQPNVRSARLDLILDEAPELKAPGIPEDLGLFNLANAAPLTGNGLNVKRFYDLSGLVGSYYEQGDVITASYGGTDYSWMISYEGVIGGDGSIAATGGTDVVLIGVPEPASVILLGLAGLALLAVRRR